MTGSKTAVIGAGAAGMMAAVFAAVNGGSVTVFEKNQKIGRKLCITGKGRCNLTNNCDVKTVISNTPTNGRFLYSALTRFSPADTMNFFEENGLPLKTERGGRVFPVSDRAYDVADTLLRAARREGCRIIFNAVSDIIIENGEVKGVVSGGKRYDFDRIIIASGGCSYPLTGSTGDGYAFAEKAGHTIVPLKPSLVPLITAEPIDSEADKLLIKNAALTVYDMKNGGRRIYSDFGELQFMNYGLSGAVILSASAHLREMESGRYRISIDLKPALSEEKLDARLLRETGARHTETMPQLMRSLLPAGMVGMFVRMSGVPASRKCSELTRTERRRIAALLKDFSLTIEGFRPIEEAIVTSGGVSVKEIDPRTMESRLVRGLYFAGEVIDVDAYTGGFNLQCAFSTGALAGSGNGG